MTPLADEILKILIAESAYPPLSAASLSRVLHVTGYSGRPEPVPVHELEGVLQDLMAVGQVERVYLARLGARYRVMPQPAAVVAEAATGTWDGGSTEWRSRSVGQGGGSLLTSLRYPRR